METILGDPIELLEQGACDVFLLPSNCFHIRTTRIARRLCERFPRVVEADSQFRKGDLSRLGTFTSAVLTSSAHRFVIVNAYTQVGAVNEGPQADVQAIRRIFKAVREKFRGMRIAYPQIPCCDWEEVSELIEEEFSGMKHFLVVDPAETT